MGEGGLLFCVSFVCPVEKLSHAHAFSAAVVGGDGDGSGVSGFGVYTLVTVGTIASHHGCYTEAAAGGVDCAGADKEGKVGEKWCHHKEGTACSFVDVLTSLMMGISTADPQNIIVGGSYYAAHRT